MKRFLIPVLILGLSACAELEAEWAAFEQAFHPEARTVTVGGRKWFVSRPDDNRPNSWKAARRDDLAPYGRPGQPRAPEGVRALELATGCKVIRSSLVQDTTAAFYADMTCT